MRNGCVTDYKQIFRRLDALTHICVNGWFLANAICLHTYAFVFYAVPFTSDFSLPYVCGLPHIGCCLVGSSISADLIKFYINLGLRAELPSSLKGGRRLRGVMNKHGHVKHVNNDLKASAEDEQFVIKPDGRQPLCGWCNHARRLSTPCHLFLCDARFLASLSDHRGRQDNVHRASESVPSTPRRRRVCIELAQGRS